MIGKRTKEDYAKHYAEEENSAYTNDYYGFIAGYEQKQRHIKALIEYYSDTLDLIEDKEFVLNLKKLAKE